MTTNYVEPFAIVVGVGDIYLAPVGEAFPAIDAAPGGNWAHMGSTDDDGVTVTHQRSLTLHTKGNSFLPQKATIESAGEEITCNLCELSVERYAKLLNDAAVTTVAAGAGTAGYKRFDIAPAIAQFALLVRGPSPVMNGYAQYEYPRVTPTGDVEVKYAKEKSLLPCTFMAWEDLSNPGRFGQFRAQTAVAV